MNEQDELTYLSYWTLLADPTLDPVKVRTAQGKDMASLREFDVYEETTTQAMGSHCAIIPTRWVLQSKRY